MKIIILLALTSFSTLAFESTERLRFKNGSAKVDFNGDGELDHCLSKDKQGSGEISCYLVKAGKPELIVQVSGVVPEYVLVHTTKSLGFFDLSFGSPGVKKKIWQWDGSAYK